MERKVEKYLKTSFELSMEQCKHHYIVSPFGIAVNTSIPFQKAVDPIQFPDYLTVISEPMDLSKITKNIKNNKYSIAETASASSAILAILRDMDLIRDNAHTYNSSPESADIRVMADALRNCFRYFLRICLKLFQRLSEPAMVSYMLHLPEIDDFLEEPGTADVAKYLEVSNTKPEVVIDKSGLIKQLGLKATTNEIKEVIQEISSLAHLKTEPVSSGKTAAKGKSTKPSTSSKEAQKSTAVKATKRNLATMQAEEDEGSSVSTPVKPKAGAATKRRKTTTSTEELYNLPYASSGPVAFTEEEDSVLFQPTITSSTSVPTLSRATSAVTLKVPRLPWVDAADSVLKAICRHPYVDPMKTATVAADFFHPVTEINPNIAEDYRRVISRPMDLNTIRSRLDLGAILDGQEFYEMLLSVFQNAVDYNAPHTESQYAMKLVDQCKHLVRYCQWLCLESLPLEDDVGKSEPEQYGDLRITLRDQARKERETIVLSASFHELLNNPYSECKKLIKDLERTSKKQELVQLSYFTAPVDVSLVTDYLVFVRQPTDLSTIKYRLDGTEPTNPIISQAINKHSPRYHRLSDFLGDIRKVFTNAKLYNKQHLETDTTQTSKAIYEAAIAFEEKLDGLIPKFTLSLADRIECARIVMKENKLLEEERQLRRLRDEEETKKLEQQMIEDYKKTDKYFAADLDIEARKKLTERQVKAQIEAKKASVLQTDSLIKASTTDEVLADDLSSPNMSPIMSPSYMNEQLAANIPNLVYGFGVGGMVPKPFQYLLEAKAVARRKAWEFFPTESSNVKPN